MIKEKDQDPKIVYANIIDHPHWQSPTRPHMSLYDRAAQFAPFAALTGYDDMVSEEARIVERRIEPGEEEIKKLNQKMNLINDAIRAGGTPMVSITYFIPDSLKAGGRYETTVEQIKKIDAARGRVVLSRTQGYGNQNVGIDMKDILEIHGELVDYLET